MDSPFVSGFVKICGVTNVTDARAVADAGAHALGLILSSSARRVTPEQAREISRASSRELLHCAVFRDEDDEVVIDTLDYLEVGAVQVHGRLGAPLLATLREKSLWVIKALAIDSAEFFTFDETVVDAVLVDGPRPGAGVEHSWAAMNKRTFRVPVIAAGGLTPENVGASISDSRAWGVDCASGVEFSPGRKDHDRVARFVANARRAFIEQGVT